MHRKAIAAYLTLLLGLFCSPWKKKASNPPVITVNSGRCSISSVLFRRSKGWMDLETKLSL